MAESTKRKEEIVTQYASIDRKYHVADLSSSYRNVGNETSSNTIARALSDTGETILYPRPPFSEKARQKAAEIDQWIDFSLTQIGPLLQSNSTFAQLEGKLGVLDKHLLQHTYLVGQSVSLADVIVIVDLIPAFQKDLGPQERAKLPNLSRWFQTLQHTPEFKSVLGSIELSSGKTPGKSVPAQANGVNSGSRGPIKQGQSENKGRAGKQEKKEKQLANSSQAKEKKPKAEKPKTAGVGGGAFDKKEKSGLSITANKGGGAIAFAEWYTQVCTVSEMISYYDVSGCYILRPWAYSVWEKIMAWFDGEIKKIDVENACFPLFITEEALTKEKDHVEGFAAEVAWVTRSGRSELQKPIAIRPTSETVMYPYFSQWIRSWRDLPLKLNQWTNVVRWEFSNPTPFIRTREFLWQEGHTAHINREEAEQEVFHILDLYAKVYTDLLAVPVTKGLKSKAEKFAGSLFSASIEGFVKATGRGIQCGTSHCLGQNFSKMFNVVFEAKDKSTQHAWQNSWGLSTRSIGVMIMVHGDDKGLVMPPRVAPVQVIVIPIPNSKLTPEESQALLAKAEGIVEQLRNNGVRVKIDKRDIYTPGWKYSHWETKGVPVRIAIGHKDMKNKTFEVARRDTGAKSFVSWDDTLTHVTELLGQIQSDMYNRAKEEYDSCIEKATNWDDFMAALGRKHMVLAPWCDEEEVEKQVKVDSAGLDASGTSVMGAKTLCIPLIQEDPIEGVVCFKTGKPAKNWALWGRSY